MKRIVVSFLMIIIFSGFINENVCSQNCWTCGTAGSFATAFGQSSSASGNHSVALGYSSSAAAIGAMAFGYNAFANNVYSVAIGKNSQANGVQSCAIGLFATASADQSYAFGKYITSAASGAIAIGAGSDAPEYRLVNPIPNSLMVGFLCSQPTLFVGASATPGSTGLVGISTSEPKQPLHVNGNLLVTGVSSSFLISDNVPQNGYLGDWGIEYYDHGLNFWKPYSLGNPGGNYYLFLKDNGNVGIGTGVPRATLDIEGTIRVASLSTQGMEEMVIADQTGVLSTFPIPTGDNLGNHVASQNINLNGYFLSGDGTDNGLFIDHASMIGINTQHPLAPFDILSQSENKLMVRTTAAEKSSLWAVNSINGYGLGVEPDGTGYIYSANPTEKKLVYFKDDKVGIGAPPKGSHYLYVAGGITTEEVKVRVQTNWSDYVFNESYKLASLPELETYISNNKHLPDVPSSEEVKNNGIELGEMNAILLKKIEELTLYIIKQDKRINEMQSKIEKIQDNSN